MYNGLRPVLRRSGLLPTLEIETLLNQARRKTGLSFFGDEWFREPLGMLIKSVNEEANLSSLGHTIIHQRLLNCLVTRLRAEALFLQYPEILEVDLGHVFVIAGLQRTGTTLLHRLLWSDPRIRASLSWEALNPVPLPGEKPGHPGVRIRQARFAQQALKYIAPQFFAIHPVEYDMPEEDILLLDFSFMSQSAEATMHVPGYASWLEKQDHQPAYEYLTKLMQLLHWQQPAQHWVLKSPNHMEHLDLILDLFPDATVIQTHRDPQQTMASFCSMVCHGSSLFSDTVEPLASAQHWLQKVKRMMQRSMDVRADRGEHQFVDLSYYALIDDPLGQLEQVYGQARVPFDDTARAAAVASRQQQPQHKYGRHHYRLQEFGLSPALIEQEFGFYRERYDIPVESGRDR